MVRKIKTLIDNELQTAKEHMNETVELGQQMGYYVDTLTTLSKRTSSNFKVFAKANQIVIKSRNANYLSISFSLLFLLWFGIGAWYEREEMPFLLFLPLGVLVAIITSAIYSKVNVITLDLLQSRVIIRSGHWLGRFLKKKKMTVFEDVVKLDARVWSTVQTDRIKMTYADIILIDKQAQKHFLLRLNHGPFYFISDKVFIQSITGIIKRTLYLP